MANTALYQRTTTGGRFSIEDKSLSTGARFFVHSGLGSDAASYGSSPDAPCATIDYAVGQCAASKNDIIYVMPGHAETISSAGAIAVDIAGISIIGLGNGANRPTITWGNTAATIAISAANVTIKNIVTKVSVDEVVSMILVTGANVTLDGVDFVETTSVQAIQWLLTTAAADYLTIKNCFHQQLNASAADQKWIQLVGTDCTRILDNTFFIVGKAATGSHLISGSTAVVYCEIARNNILFIGGTITIVINLVTGSTGLIADNRIGSGTAVTTAAAITGDGCFMFENRWADTAAASGLLAPVVDTDT